MAKKDRHHKGSYDRWERCFCFHCGLECADAKALRKHIKSRHSDATVEVSTNAPRVPE